MDPALERSFRGHKDGVSSVSFSPTMKQLVSGGLDGTVMVWNFKMQMRAFRFVGHKAAVTSVDFAPSGSLIASFRPLLTRLQRPGTSRAPGGS